MAKYTVKAGDSWEKVAQILYGDQRMFGELMRANAGIGSRLRPGDVLRIPDQRRNPYVSNAQAALAGIPQNPRGQLYNAYDRAGTPNASVAVYDKITGEFTTTPIGGAPAGPTSNVGSAGLGEPDLYKRLQSGRQVLPGPAAAAPRPVQQPGRGGVPRAPAPTPQSGSFATPQYSSGAGQSASAPGGAYVYRQPAQAGSASGGGGSGAGVAPPYFVAGVPTGAGLRRFGEIVGGFGPAIQGLGQNAAGAIASAFQSPRQQPQPGQPLQSGIGPPAQASTQQQTANQQATAPGALQTIVPPMNATSGLADERITYTSPAAASAPELTLQTNLDAFTSAAFNKDYSRLPAVLTAADILAMATAKGAPIETVTATAASFGYSGVIGGNMYLTGAGGSPIVEQNAALSPSGGMVNSGLPDATWAEASSLYGLPRGYSAPTYNTYGYTAGGRRNPSSISAGAYGLPVLELSISSGTNQ